MLARIYDHVCYYVLPTLVLPTLEGVNLSPSPPKDIFNDQSEYCIYNNNTHYPNIRICS